MRGSLLWCLAPFSPFPILPFALAIKRIGQYGTKGSLAGPVCGLSPSTPYWRRDLNHKQARAPCSATNFVALQGLCSPCICLSIPPAALPQ